MGLKVDLMEKEVEIIKAIASDISKQLNINFKISFST